MSEMRMQYYQY